MGIAPETLQALGVSGVLVVLGGAIIKWLLDDRKRILEALSTAQAENSALRDKRADELLAQAKVLAQSSDVVRDALTDVTKSLDRLERTMYASPKPAG